MIFFFFLFQFNVNALCAEDETTKGFCLVISIQSIFTENNKWNFNYFLLKILVQGEDARKKVKVCILFIFISYKKIIDNVIYKISLKRKVN